ncbi:hypothetical protein FACS1894206_04190 [Deltaproteobacteria bacterium]|nr:hypothetical protein FACS1894206_04190 [Deltaproteobacteria bacterium]
MQIRVKYCGGCNPRYDRRSLGRKLGEEFPEAEIVESSDETVYDFVAVLCGCPAVCADHQDLRGKFGKMVLSSPEEYDALTEAIRHIPL